MTTKTEAFCGGERLRAILKDEFERFGYARYTMRKFEPYSLYAGNLPFLKDEHILTFSDQDGTLMALKPDITLSIAKNARSGEKLYYTESVYRPSEDARSFREISQMGLECFGRADDYATAEVVRLALTALRATGGRYALDIGHMGFVSALMDAAACAPAQRETISRLLGDKNAHELSAFCGECGFSEDIRDAFLALVTLRCALREGVARAAALVRSDEMRRALIELSALSDALEALGVARGVSLDFSIMNDLNYYNGVVLRGYVEGVPRAVLSGGRYDLLLRRLGKSEQAIGFAVYLDELTRYLSRPEPYDVDMLCLYDESADTAALSRALDLIRATGKSVRAAAAVPDFLRYRTLARYENGVVSEVRSC